MTYPLGVDIGTTYTAAALWRDGRVQTVPLGNRANAVPSVLFLRDDGKMLVGEAAARRGITDPDRQAREFKRRMGDDVPVLVGGRGFSAQQLTAEVLRWAVDRVSEVQGGPPQHVVLTHPASWGEFRCGLLLEAARGAGLGNVGLLPEPVAASTWYAAQERIEPDALIGIYDFGGGTFDASVVRKTATGVEIFGEAGGDDSIGGIDFDHALFRHVGASAGVDISQFDLGDPVAASALAQLFSAVVEAKEALSADVEVIVPVVLPGVSQQVLVTRAQFEELIRERVLGTVGVFGEVVRRTGVDPARLHGVLLVGGSSRIPLVRQLLSAELGIRVAVDAHPKYTVSLGAAIAAAPRITGAPRPPAPPARGPGPVRPMPPAPQQATAPRPLQLRPMHPSLLAPRPAAPRVDQHSDPSLPLPAPAVSEHVDLASSGLGVAPEPWPTQPPPQQQPPPQPMAPVAVAAPPRPAEQVFEPPVAPKPKSGKGKLLVLIAVLAVAGVGAALFVFLPRASNKAESAASPNPASPAAPAPKAVGKITLGGEAVVEPAGADVMLGITSLPSGHGVEVGHSADSKPRAWVTEDKITPVTVPSEGPGAMLDVTATDNGAVAVGWTGAPPRAAVWTSENGSSWKIQPAAKDFVPNSGVTKLTAVTAGDDGKQLVAIGRDERADKTDGDAVVYSSADAGASWTPVKATELSGPGPQEVTRLMRFDGKFVAVGSAHNGGKRGVAIWTSADGTGWELSTRLPEGAEVLSGVAKSADDALLVCGSFGTGGGTGGAATAACWTRDEEQRWSRWDVVVGKNSDGNDSPVPQALHGLFSTSRGVAAVGSGRLGNATDAAMWSMAFTKY